jgi:hypothetical protein
VCGREGNWELHHPTGTDRTGQHLDPEFVIALCVDHHPFVHDDWKTQRVEEADEELDSVGLVQLRLRRVGSTYARIARGADPQPEATAVLAGMLAEWADDLM